jgi:hypothetical protein
MRHVHRVMVRQIAAKQIITPQVDYTQLRIVGDLVAQYFISWQDKLIMLEFESDHLLLSI